MSRARSSSRTGTSPPRTCGPSCRCSRRTAGTTSSSGSSRPSGRRGSRPPPTWRRSARPTRRQGRLALSREALEAATGSRPDDGALLLALARVAYDQTDLEGALGYLGHARAVTPQDPRVHFFLGMVCVELDLGAEAYAALGEAVRLDPDSPEANYAFGSVAMHRKDPTEAVPYFRRYSELKPDDYRGPYAVGVALFLAKDYEAARSAAAAVRRARGDRGRGELPPRADRPRAERGRGGAAPRPARGGGGPAQRRRVLRARAPLPAFRPGGARRGGPDSAASRSIRTTTSATCTCCCSTRGRGTRGGPRSRSGSTS